MHSLRLHTILLLLVATAAVRAQDADAPRRVIRAEQPEVPGRSAIAADLANGYAQNGDLTAAMRALERELARNPGNASLALRLIAMYQRLGMIKEAKAVCERALAAGAESPGLALQLYQLHKADGTIDEYVEQLSRRSDDGDVDATRRLAEVYFREKRHAEAIEAFERLAAARPDDVVVHQRLGWLYRETEDLAKARAHYEEAMRLNPGSISVYGALGEVCARMGDRQAALDAWRKSARYSPNDRDSVRRLGRLLYTYGFYSEARDVYEDARTRLGDDSLFASEMASVLEAQLDVEGAIREYLKAVTGQRAPYRTPSRSAEMALQLALDEDKRDFLIAEASRLWPQHADNGALAHLLLRAYLAGDDTAAAAALVEQLGDRSAAVQSARGDILTLGERFLAAGDAARAAAVFGRLLETPGDVLIEADAALGAAEALGLLGRWDDAAGQLEAVVERRGREAVSTDVLFRLADIYLRRLHEVAKAREIFEAVAREAQDLAIRHDAEAGVADCLFAVGEYEEAAAAYARLRAPRWLDVPTPPRPPFVRGDVYGDGRLYVGLEPSERGQFMVAECAFRQGSLAEAARLFKEFAERHPDSKYTNDALARVELLEHDMRQDPDGAATYVRALNLADRGEVREAADALQGLADTRPEGPLADDALLAAATMLSDAGDSRAAVEKCEALATAHPESLLRPEALLLEGRLLAGSLGRPKEALAVYARVAAEYRDAPAGRRAANEADDLRRALAKRQAQ